MGSRIPTSAVTLPASVAVGVGVGGAVGGAIEPRLRAIQNTAWRRFQTMPLEAIQAAELVASGERPPEWGANEALNMGIDGDRFAALVDLVDTAPDLATLFELWRRSEIDATDFRDGARKGTIEDKWIGPLMQLKRRLLSPDELANSVVQGHRTFDAALPDAERQGVNASDFQTMVDNTGLPPGPETLLDWLRRGVVNEGEVIQGIREGHTKVKYTEPYLETRNRVTRADTAASLWLRGWIDEAEAKQIGALTGYGPEQMDHLYLNRGRPATTRQVHIGFARGGNLEGANLSEREIHRRAVRQSNIRTEYEPLLWAQRYTYPSAFVIRALAQDGTFDGPTTREILIDSGWRPDLAELAAEKWTGGAATVATKWLDRSRTRLFTTAHAEFLDGNLDSSAAEGILRQLGATAAEATAAVNLWEAEQQIDRTELSPTVVKKLYKATRWTFEKALGSLVARGYDPADATDFLEL